MNTKIVAVLTTVLVLAAMATMANEIPQGATLA